jgi:hypothetical protein
MGHKSKILRRLNSKAENRFSWSPTSSRSGSQALISSTGAQIGIHESRRIEREYTLTKEDVTAGKAFDEVICKSGYPIDIHAPSGNGMEIAWVEGDGSFNIQYRTLIPKKINNLLVAGRCISTTHEALATTRLTPSAMAVGQAARTVAVIALDSGIPPRDIDVKALLEGVGS